MATGMSIAGRGLARRFGPRWALAGLDVDIAPGELIGLTGPNGSGKSTLLRLLATALRADAGWLKLDGQDAWGERSELRPAIALASHATGLWDDLSAAENLGVWARMSGVAPDVIAQLRRVGLDPDRRDPIRTFSAGMKRRLALARLFLRRPRLALLDEPSTALDVNGRFLVRGLIEELISSGTTVVVATHHREELDGASVRWMALQDGRAA